MGYISKKKKTGKEREDIGRQYKDLTNSGRHDVNRQS